MMNTVLIISDDADVGKLLTLIIEGEKYEAVHIETVKQILKVTKTYDFVILDRPFNLLSEDWDLLRSLKEDKQNLLPIVITDSPQTEWLKEKSKETGIDMILPYPCDLTVEIPKILEDYFGN